MAKEGERIWIAEEALEEALVNRGRLEQGEIASESSSTTGASEPREGGLITELRRKEERAGYGR